MEMQHRLSSTLRNTGHTYIADELDRLLALLGSVHNEVSANRGRIDHLTHYKLAAVIATQAVFEHGEPLTPEPPAQSTGKCSPVLISSTM